VESESSASAAGAVPVNVITGFLGSGKTTLLQRLLSSPKMARTVVLINELGEIGLDHLLIERVEESIVLLKSGCICCSIRDDLRSALRGLLSRREQGEIPEFDRVVIETTGLADPGPILYTLACEPVVRHHFRLANVITTVDALNANLHLSRNPEGVKQVAAADRLVITKSDLADPAQTAAVREMVERLNPSAEILDAANGEMDPDQLLADQASDVTRHTRFGRQLEQPEARADPMYLQDLRRHSASVASLSLVLDQPLDWTAFGIWLSMLLNRHGDDVLRVKGILQVQGLSAPVFINAVQHIVHPPQHLKRWPTTDHRSRIVFITRRMDHALLGRSLTAFARSPVSDVSYA
jgi:G3E family GTPase